MQRGYREEKEEERQRGAEERWTGATGKRIIDPAG